jgi:hypothetical protein
MKFKLVALVLSLTIASWAQSTNSSTPEPKSADTKSTCSCCAKADTANQSDPKQTHACMRKTADGKEVMACCEGKDAKACSGEACSKHGEKDAASCCAKTGDTQTMACCSGKNGSEKGCCDGKQCGQHDHHEHSVPGN